ncbi:Asp-tRNA(Asn)/Glu-tRNA(Gln) amidotransferase subunit GatC [Patescibacteria group bacterium]|nr:Asp-tRNA(Asn)/Glu-tRNA(Gln) amidotransferase subunit GatC [Patescibacteria group bacterium]
MFDVSHIAKLARLGLSQEDEKKFAKDLAAILDFFGKLKEVEVEGVEPTAQVTGLQSVMRPDESLKRQPDSRQKLLANTPNRKGDYIKVKAVFE